jgi:hypothetical protein
MFKTVILYFTDAGTAQRHTWRTVAAPEAAHATELCPLTAGAFEGVPVRNTRYY